MKAVKQITKKSRWMANASVSLAILFVSYVYFTFLAAAIPQEQKVLVNIVLVPIGLGLMGGFSLRGAVYERILCVSIVPCVTVLLLESDPTKPGLELMLMGPLLIFYVMGVLVASGILAFYKGR